MYLQTVVFAANIAVTCDELNSSIIIIPREVIDFTTIFLSVCNAVCLLVWRHFHESSILFRNLN
jgi:hypothetical protein